MNINGENYTTFEEYMNDETKVTKEEKAQIELEVELLKDIAFFD